MLIPATAALLLGCAPTTPVDDSGNEASSSAESSADTGSTSQGQTSGQTPSTGVDTDPTGAETEALPCPPIDIPGCVTCECVDGEWACDESACISNCTGQACGTSCVICPQDLPDCDPTSHPEGVCTADERCVSIPPPKLGFCEGALQPGFEGELEQASGCSDMVVFARDAADERGLVLHVEPGLYAEAMASGMPVHAELDVTDDTLDLEGRAGFYVTALECSDFIENEPDIKEHWYPQAGTVIIDLVPIDDVIAEATVQLVGVELQRLEPGPLPIVVDLTWSAVTVGPVPG